MLDEDASFLLHLAPPAIFVCDDDDDDDDDGLLIVCSLSQMTKKGIKSSFEKARSLVSCEKREVWEI